MVSVLNPKLYRVTDVDPSDAYYSHPEDVVGAVVRGTPDRKDNPLRIKNGRARGWALIVSPARGNTFPQGRGYDAGDTFCFFDVGVEELK